MTMDELNQAINLKLQVINEKGKHFEIVSAGALIDNSKEDVIFLVNYRKVKANKLGRLRVMDLTTFVKTHEVAR